MTYFKERIRFIFLPYLILSTSIITGYSSLNWLLVKKLDIVNFDEDIVNYWLPIALTCLLVLLFLRKGAKILKPKNRNKSKDGFWIIPTLLISIPVVIAQVYVDGVSGELTILKNIGDINKQPTTTFYKLKQHGVDKANVAVYSESRTEGKYGSTLVFDINVIFAITDTPEKTFFDVPEYSGYFDDKSPLIILNDVPLIDPRAFPVIKLDNIERVAFTKPDDAVKLYGDKAKDGVVSVLTNTKYYMKAPSGEGVKGCLAVTYSKSISNHSSQAEKETAYKQFAKETERRLMTDNLNDFIYLKRLGHNRQHRAMLKAGEKIGLNPAAIILEAKNSPFENRGGNKLLWVISSWLIGAAIWFLLILIPKINTTALNT